jgi:hypothetical protein
MVPESFEQGQDVFVRNLQRNQDTMLVLCVLTAVLIGCASPPPPPESDRLAEATTYTVQEAEEERSSLISNYIENDAYTGFESEADGRQTDAGPFHHAALTVSRDQYEGLINRLEERDITYTTISHEILDTITLTDPNGILLELSVWNIDPKDVQM